MVARKFRIADCGLRICAVFRRRDSVHGGVFYPVLAISVFLIIFLLVSIVSWHREIRQRKWTATPPCEALIAAAAAEKVGTQLENIWRKEQRYFPRLQLNTAHLVAWWSFQPLEPFTGSLDRKTKRVFFDPVDNAKFEDLAFQRGTLTVTLDGARSKEINESGEEVHYMDVDIISAFSTGSNREVVALSLRFKLVVHGVENGPRRPLVSKAFENRGLRLIR